MKIRVIPNKTGSPEGALFIVGTGHVAYWLPWPNESHSFRNILTQVYGRSKISYDYYPRHKIEPPHIPANTKGIHGHFHVAKYEDFFPLAKRIIWLRNPVDRLISLYFFWKHRGGETNPWATKIKQGDMDMLEFANSFLGKEISDYVRGRKLNNFYFIGIQEHFKEDILELKNLLDWPEIDIETRKHKNPDSNYQEEYLKVVNDDRMMSSLSDILAPEIEIYQEALQLREQRLKINKSEQQNIAC